MNTVCSNLASDYSMLLTKARDDKELINQLNMVFNALEATMTYLVHKNNSDIAILIDEKNALANYFSKILLLGDKKTTPAQCIMEDPKKFRGIEKDIIKCQQ